MCGKIDSKNYSAEEIQAILMLKANLEKIRLDNPINILTVCNPLNPV